MREDEFRDWLGLRLAESAVKAAVYKAKRVESSYGDLDDFFEQDRLDLLISELSYTKKDFQSARPNSSKIDVDQRSLHNVLPTLQTALRSYRDFREDPLAVKISSENSVEVAVDLKKERREGKQFELERHLQEALRKEIQQLETGLTIIDGDGERSVESGRVDILAQDQDGKLVVIELKSGTAKREAIGQIVGYMGDLMLEDPDVDVRGILVAADFDKSCQSGVRAVPTLSLMRYRFSFTFETLV